KAREAATLRNRAGPRYRRRSPRRSRVGAPLVYPRARVSDRRSPTSSVIRPRLRGVADIYAAALAVPAVVALVACAREGAPTLAALVYGVSHVVLLVGSAVSHLPGWPLRTALWLRKLDHANIYLLIAGTSSPLALVIDP